MSATEHDDPTQPGRYVKWTDQHLRFSDTDMLGHVNNVAIAALHESGRVGYGYELGQQAPPPSQGFLLAHLEIDYLAELHYPSALRVGARLLRVGRTSMDVGTGIFLPDDKCVSVARGVLVQLGPDGPLPIEGAFRELLEAELSH